tara:strand:+ start:103 stop:546 length:444 start_codon:yes stop_codon:yes gene_type:complete
MSRDTKWCQNPKCPEKKNSNQIRGRKGKKYYQSNKANGYGNGNFCTLHCYDEWSNIYLDRAIDSIGVRLTEPVKVNMENAWFVIHDSNWNTDRREWDRYYLLRNQLLGVSRSITRLQATGNNRDDYSPTISSAQATELAKQLGLTQQ